ncbi:tetratricopeptide repeat protein [Candidatus Binatus sp.]|uniref:tetratricopeptide repeat protein n=1 Tax=Candidatus Binatus sp. TaxID=2811406 RepID=UPI002F93569F
MADCSQCETPFPTGAKFCAACGNRVDAAGADKFWRPSDSRPRRSGFSASWIAAVSGAFLVGAALTWLLMPAGKHDRSQVAMQPTIQKRAPILNAQASGMPPGHSATSLPAGHPMARGQAHAAGTLIAKAEKQAKARPKDIEVWNRLGDVAFRSAAFDPANDDTAREAFTHVLELDPDNLDALRGLGNVSFDQRRFDKAIAAYQHYLGRKPKDVQVLTDLGTMYLAQHNSHEAIARYAAALSLEPGFFPAQFNLAVAYLLLNDTAHAREALSRARALAPGDAARTRIDLLLARIDSNEMAKSTAASKSR